MKRIICIIQARMGSERLPGKVLMPINGAPMLGYQIARINTQMPDLDIVVATSDTPKDDALYDYCRRNEVSIFRGAEHNVLKRFHDVVVDAKLADDDLVIRLTGDCPLTCPDLIQALINFYQESGADYGRIDTDSFPRGVDAEVFTVAMLKQAYHHASSNYEQEHVTPFFYDADNGFQVVKYINPEGNHSQYRLCVDEAADFSVVNQLFALLGKVWPDCDYRALMDVVCNHPEVTSLNQNVQQR